MTGTERLNTFIETSFEKKLKPQGMCSKLFWEIHNLILEVQDAQNYPVCGSREKSRKS